MSVRSREFRFAAEVTWDGAQRTTVRVDGKEPLRIATPPEFKGSGPDVWSPEDAFVAAAGSCLAVTIAALAEREHLPIHELGVKADGVVGRRPDGTFGFVRIEQAVRVATDAEHEETARALVAKAEETCLVSVSLDLPVETSVEIKRSVPAV